MFTWFLCSGCMVWLWFDFVLLGGGLGGCCGWVFKVGICNFLVDAFGFVVWVIWCFGFD